MLGAYRIISQVGQGGMASVYKAYQAAMDRYVAVKVLPSQFAKSAEFMGRFQQEARTIANLEHAHILPIYDYGENDGITYFVMRYLETGTLKERITAGALTLAETDRLFTQLADALGYAHARGVIHRDIKPSNALVDSHGDLFLTDFGIAKLLESAAHFTASGALTGTPAYMSPEQARGERLDARSDIYSLGIVLYEMVTGRVPFEAETPLAVVLKHLQDPLPLPSTIKPDLDPAIERVLLKALAKDPNDRFATTGEFLAAWKKALSGEAYAEMAATGGSASAPSRATLGTITRVPTVRPAADQTAARRTLPIIPILIGLAALAIIAVMATLMINSRNKATATARLPATSSVEATSTVAAAVDLTAATPLPVDSNWTSWAAGNTVYSVAVSGDQVISGGPGGLTVWDRADGSIARRFTTADGLPDATVNVVFVDGDGTLWLGTSGGLAHFDGESWTSYTTEDGLDSNYVTALARIGDSLIVGTQYSYDGGGLNLFGGTGWTHAPSFPSASPDENPDKLSYNINAIAQTPTGQWLVGTTNGLGTFDGAAWSRLSTADGLPDNNVTALLADASQEALIGTSSGAVRFENSNISPIEQLRGVQINSILRALDGDLWFSGGGGLWRFDPGRANWESYAEPTGELPSFTMFGAAMDSDGALYFGSETGGLVRYDGKAFTTWMIPNVPSQAAYGKIFSAPDGLLWFVQEYGANIDTFDTADETWAQLFSLPCSCDPVLFDPDGNLWAGEYNNGFWVIGKDSATHVNSVQGIPPEAQVRAVALSGDKSAWIGTDLGIMLFDGATVTGFLDATAAGLPDIHVRTLFAASDGSMWVGTESGLSHRLPDGTWEHFVVGNPFSYTVSITDIAEDSGGVIWASTEGDGIYRFAGGNWEHFTFNDPGVALPSSYVHSVTVAPDGSVWFGTASGAARFNGSKWLAFRLSDGLINANVNDVFVDGSGAAWFATSGGVSRYRP